MERVRCYPRGACWLIVIHFEGELGIVGLGEGGGDKRNRRRGRRSCGDTIQLSVHDGLALTDK